ncbi:hypothetical protein H1P_2290012 [Hyella patelloides LEGE 07179]|uniref:Uncharacterized protein n=1 Tax=Hyella patelloides LEGE 07179 TaxID=945734 RepID=A0A563VR42_9CYAN|nr:hypothetical protein [Hyella patelloides]VEP13932.1 hypothetical protein H1P_2290012 [Hyella patelloides LEGE 07179]
MGLPRSPQELVNHDGIFFRITSTNNLAPWIFLVQDRRYTIEPRQRFIVIDNLTNPFFYSNAICL